MFTGIVEECGTVGQIIKKNDSVRLTVRSRSVSEGVTVGDSVAVNGCCLTVVKIRLKPKEAFIEFDLLAETWARTNFHAAKVGSFVNLERALKADGRLGGHFVSGHIDGVAKIKTWQKQGADRFLELTASPEILRYIVFKGSVALDGISLTVATVSRKCFAVWIIPHTYEVTTLRERAVGDSVNVEIDMLAKYVERFVSGAAKC